MSSREEHTQPLPAGNLLYINPVEILFAERMHVQAGNMSNFYMKSYNQS